MESRPAIVSFEEVPVRKIWHEKEQWIAAIDVAKALGYDNPSREASTVIKRHKERFEGYTTTRKMRVVEGGIEKSRGLQFLNLKGVIAFCMLCNLPKAIPFQRWADSVLEKHINKIPADIKMIATTKRVKFTDELKEHGVDKPYHYANITKSMKDKLGIDKEKPKANCDLIEVMKIAAAEDIARINLLQSEANGYSEVKPICDKSSEVVAIGTAKQTTVQY